MTDRTKEGQVATIDGFRANALGGNNFSMVFDGCVSCQRSGAKPCERCRKPLQLRGKGLDGSPSPQPPVVPSQQIEAAAYTVDAAEGFAARMAAPSASKSG